MVTMILLVIFLLFDQSVASTRGSVYQMMVNRTDYVPTGGYISYSLSTRSKTACGTTCSITPNCTTFYYASDVAFCQIHDSLPDIGTSVIYMANITCYSTEDEPSITTTSLATTTTTPLPTTTMPCAYGTYSYNSGEKCYFFDDGLQRNFDDSVTFCSSNGGVIVKIDTEPQNLFIKNMLNNNGLGGASYYIGLNDRQVQNDFRWSDLDQTQPVYENWGGGNPSNSNEDCVVMYGGDSLNWHNTHCSNTWSVVCEK